MAHLITAGDGEAGRIYRTSTGKKVKLIRNREDNGERSTNALVEVEREGRTQFSMGAELYPIDGETGGFVSAKDLRLEKLAELKARKKAEKEAERREIEEARRIL